MSRDLRDMVAIAAGSKETVAQWAHLLKRAIIGYHIETTSRVGRAPRHRELWVAEVDAEDAKHVLRSANLPGVVLFW